MSHATNALAQIHRQIMWNRLIAVVEEQAQIMIRTAFSTTVREAGDLSADRLIAFTISCSVWTSCRLAIRASCAGNCATPVSKISVARQTASGCRISLPGRTGCDG